MGVPVLEPRWVVAGDALAETAGDVGKDEAGAGLPDDEQVAMDTELLDTDGVVEPDAGALGVGVGDLRTATLRAVMVALSTPASLASQE